MAKAARTTKVVVTEVLLPKEGYVRLPQIIGDFRTSPPIPGPIPVRKTCWLEGVKKGLYPKPVKLGPKAVGWRVEDIRALIKRLGIGEGQ